MEFSYIDLIILVPILFGLYKGFTKGLILSLATLIGMFLGIYGGVQFSHITSQYLYKEFNIDIPLVAFAVTFLVIMIVVYLLGKLITKFVDVIALGVFNKIGGALFGAGRMILILTVLLLFFENANAAFQLVKQEIIDDSQLYGLLKDSSEVIFPYFEELKSNIPDSLSE